MHAPINVDLKQISIRHNLHAPSDHSKEYERVDDGVGHGEEVEGEEDALAVLRLHDGWQVVLQEEVDVVGAPAHREDRDHHRQHLHDLKVRKIEMC